MTTEPEERRICVVMGTSGEGADRRQWPVAAYQDEVWAQQHVFSATRRAREIVAALGQTGEEPARAFGRLQAEGRAPANPYDPAMAVVGGGVDYFYFFVPLRREVPAGPWPDPGAGGTPASVRRIRRGDRPAD